MSTPIGVGIIGSGLHGGRYANHIINDLPGLKLTAISRRSAVGEEQGRRWGCVWHRDWRALVADDRVEAVIVATTPNLNPAIARACGKAGKPLLLEKPLAIDVPRAEEAIAAHQGACDCPFTIAQTLRYNSIILALRRELPRAGRLHSLIACQRLERSQHAWLEDPSVAGGGVILHTAVHMFDALRFITGREVVAVNAHSWRRYNPGVEDLFTGALLFEGDLPGLIDGSKVGPARAGRYEFTGDQGQLQGDQVHGILQFITGMEISDLPVEPPGPALVPLLADWERCLRGEGENPIPVEEGLAALRICDAVARSAVDGCEVCL
ncbi:MAG: Gfo/Idh/MocA family oxidoreductase [bacterium]|nr:Gfo/Idh/MocA family oxidoreductase [bacterium]